MSWGSATPPFSHPEKIQLTVRPELQALGWTAGCRFGDEREAVRAEGTGEGEGKGEGELTSVGP